MTGGPDLEQVLEICLSRLRDGDTLDACLASYPMHAEQLDPLLRVAVMLQASTRPAMSAKGFRSGEKRLLERATQLQAKQQRAMPASPGGSVSCLLASMRRLIAATVVALSLFCVALSAGVVTVSAASSSLPGSPLYPIKRTTENLVSSIAFSPQLQTRVHLAWAERRLDEARAMIDRDGITYRTVLVALKHETEQALTAAKQSGPESLTAVVAHTEHQQMVLRQLLDQAPEATRSELKRALATSTEANDRARFFLERDLSGKPTASPVPRTTLPLAQPTHTPQPPKLGEPPQPTQTFEQPTTAQPGSASEPLETPEQKEFPAPIERSQPPGTGETPALPEPTEPLKTVELTDTPRPPEPTETSGLLEPTEAPALLEPTKTPGPPPELVETPQLTEPTETSQPANEPTAETWDRSSLQFVDEGFNCDEGGTVWANVRNTGDEAMAGPTSWELWYASNGPPASGQMIAIGEIPALQGGQKHLISAAGTKGPGNYMFKAYQRPGHPGTGVLKSDAIFFEANQCSD